LGSPRLLISAGAQAAAQGLIRSALLTKLLPFAAAGALVVRLFGKGSTETRPAAGNVTSTTPSKARQWPGSGRAASRWPAGGRNMASEWPADGRNMASGSPAHGQNMASAWPETSGRTVNPRTHEPGRSRGKGGVMKTNISDSLNDLRGRMGKWVYRRFEGGVVVARRPKERTTPPSEAQIRAKKRFAKAASYARAVFADPLRKAPYVAKAKLLGKTTVWAMVARDYLKPPVVEEIDHTGYFGRAGNPIRITATDDFEVVSVKVTIRDSAGATIETGLAVKGDTEWVYTAQTAVPSGEIVNIEAEATDRAGNQRTLSEARNID
jgi:hypothetical protein